MPLPPVPIPEPEKSRWFNNHLPYRVRILGGLDYYNATGGPRGIHAPVFGGIFEANLLACRWMMDFLGVKGNGTSLEEIKTRKNGDVFCFDLGGIPLNPASLGLGEEDRLVKVYEGSNRASAHAVRENCHHMVDMDVQPAALILVRELRKCVYQHLGLPVSF